MRFSVIVPLYNKEPYVEKALRSILGQTFYDFELVIVNDGSKDNSLAVAEKVLAGIGNARIINQENSGVSTARNNGVSASKGEYICFLDADDWWEPMFLEEMSKLVDEYPDAGIYGTGYTIINEHKRRTRVAPIGVDEGFEKGYINYCQVYAKTLAMPLCTGAVCIPRRIFDGLGGFKANLKLGEDFDLWIRIALKYKVVFLNKSLSNYNQDVDGANRGVGKLHKLENHMLWNLGYLEDEENTNPDYKQLIDNLRTYGLMPYFLSEQYHESAKVELKKVDWDSQPKSIRKKYQSPLWLLRCHYRLMDYSSKSKQLLIKILH